MRFKKNLAFVAAAATAVAGAAALSGAAPHGVPDDPPKDDALEGILDAWKEQLLECGLMSAPQDLAGFTADTLSLMDETHPAVESRAESAAAAAHLIEQIAIYQTETYLCILEKRAQAGGVDAP